MARVRGFTSILRRHRQVPAFLSGNTGSGRTYPFGAMLPALDGEWDLFAAFMGRVRAWQYEYDNRITVEYTNLSRFTYNYQFSETGTAIESASPFSDYLSATCPGST